MGNLIMIAAGMCLLFIAIFIYFIPFVIAHKRKHHNRNAIFILNLFLGWSYVGWVVSLSWALTRVELR